MSMDRMNATGVASAVRAAICATAATTTATPVMAQDDAEPLATNVTGADKTGAGSDGNDNLGKQQYFIAFGVGKYEDTQGYQGN